MGGKGRHAIHCMDYVIVGSLPQNAMVKLRPKLSQVLSLMSRRIEELVARQKAEVGFKERCKSNYNNGDDTNRAVKGTIRANGT